MDWATLRQHITSASPTTTLALLSILAVVALSPLWGNHWFYSHELNDPIQRVIALAHEMRNGDLYPRWISAGFYGHGLPFFNYYSPGYYFASAYLFAAGIPIILSMKIVVWLAFVLGAFGVYLWTRKHTSNQAALLAAIIYLFVPYHFVDLYVRGAMSEFTALAILPYLFHGIDLSFSQQQSRGIIVTAFSSALIVITHNLSALMILPLAFVYFVILAFHHKASPKTIGIAALGAIIGALISAFYWLPVIAERSYIAPLEATMASGYYGYQNHLISFTEWFDFSWGFAPFRAGFDAPMNFQLGITLLVFLVVALLSLNHIPERSRLFSMTTLSLGLAGLLLTSPLADFIYQLIPPLQMIQFPWRFMGPSTLFISAFCALAIYIHKHRYTPIALILVAVILAITLSSEQRQLFQAVQVTPEYAQSGFIYSRNIGPLNVKNEYLPIWSHEHPATPLAPSITSGIATISNVSQRSSKQSFTITAKTDSTALIPWHYYPGWKVLIDGSETGITPSEMGFITFPAPEGTHQIEVYFGTTPPRIIGWILAITGLLLLLLLSTWLRHPHHRSPS